MRKETLLGLVLLTASAFADGEMIAAQMSSDMQSGKMEEQKMMPTVVTLTSARPESDNGWYVFADVLYWHADVGNSDWAFRNNNINAGSGVIAGPNHKLDFKWSWGFRAGLGVNMDHDSWDSNVYYTWFHTRNSNAVGTATNGTQAAVDNQGSTQLVTSGEIDWRIHFSMFDWELGRWYYVSKCLALRPHVGLKGGWIHQKVDRDWTVDSQTGADADLENDFWGIGAAGGVNTAWMLGNVGMHRFSIFGDFAAAILYGHFDVDQRETTRRNGVVISGNHPDHLDRNLAVPMLQAMFGLGWDVPFNRDRCHFGLKVGYEFQYWMRQNQMLNMKNAAPFNTVQYWRNSDDLALQGITGEFRFDF
jgi:major outer membrane protein